MSDTLRVRFYNVRFGDAILITVPDRNTKTKKVTTRRILVDFGNAPLVASPEGGDDSVFKPVLDHILEELDGAPIDLYVMTHEHLDHAQGLPHAAKKSFPNGELAEKLPIHYAWLTASAHEDYYDTASRREETEEGVPGDVRPDREAPAARGNRQDPAVPALPVHQQPGEHEGVREVPPNGRDQEDELRPPQRREAGRWNASLQAERNASVQGGEIRDLGSRGRHERVLRDLPATRPGRPAPRSGRRGTGGRGRSAAPGGRGHGSVLQPRGLPAPGHRRQHTGHRQGGQRHERRLLAWSGADGGFSSRATRRSEAGRRCTARAY